MLAQRHGFRMVFFFLLGPHLIAELTAYSHLTDMETKVQPGAGNLPKATERKRRRRIS